MPSVAVEVEVAEAVLEALRHQTFTVGATFGRTYDTTQQLEDANVLHIDVIGAGHKIIAMARGLAARDPIVQVVIRKRLGNTDITDDKAEQDRLVLLAEEIEDLFFQDDLEQYEASWQATETIGPIDDPDFHKWRQVTIIVALTFRTYGD